MGMILFWECHISSNSNTNDEWYILSVISQTISRIRAPFHVGSGPTTTQFKSLPPEAIANHNHIDFGRFDQHANKHMKQRLALQQLVYFQV